MDVNTGDLSQKEFKELSGSCKVKVGWECTMTTFACKDYLCPIVKAGKDTSDVRARFAAAND